MEWCQSGIAEAVTESRKNGAIFVVYIEGKDDHSKHVTETINSPTVSKMLNSQHFIAILVEKDSIAHLQFSEIYKQTTAPSIYFIGKTGAPLEILTDASLTPAEMENRINEIIVKNGGQPMEPMRLEEEEEKPSSTINAASSEVAPAPQEPPVEPREVADASSQHQLPIEEKLRLAQELIAKKRREKEEEEKEKERSKELERRKLGQDVQRLKRWQQDEDIRQLMDERERARREDRDARDRVRRQIEEDRREKAARNASNAPPPPPTEAAPRMPARPAASDTARLQFRLPDGTQITHDFKSSACLQEVIDYLQLNRNLRDFVLSTTFPKREFTANDASQNLTDLQLVPNAAMLVLPCGRRRAAVASGASGGGVVGMLWYLLAPILGLLDYLKSFVRGAPRTSPSAPADDDNKKRANVDAEPSGSGGAKRRPAGEPPVKKQGNVHRLHEHDSDEDNNTWNGNSTQQM